MPKRKIKDSLLPPDAENAALEAIREAFKHPRILSAEEERDFLERRARGLRGGTIERHEYIVAQRRGKLVYREHGKAGADLSVPPYYWEMLKRRRDFEAECAKVDRAINTLLRNKQFKGNAAAEQRRAIIVAMVESLKHLPPRNRASVAAGKLGIPVRTVRNALQKSGKSRK